MPEKLFVCSHIRRPLALRHTVPVVTSAAFWPIVRGCTTSPVYPATRVFLATVAFGFRLSLFGFFLFLDCLGKDIMVTVHENPFLAILAGKTMLFLGNMAIYVLSRFTEAKC
jgi:hypothetical protein